MADDPLLLTIDDNGQLQTTSRTVLRRLAARRGQYRLLPSPADLLLFERVDAQRTEASGMHGPGHVVLAGELDRVGGVVDLIHFIHGNAWSGQLSVIAGAARKTIFFKRGDVTTAASNVAEDRLGAILYRFGMITAAELEKTLTQVTQEQRFGQVLVENGTLTVHDLYQYVRKQVEEIFYSILVLRSGEYYFYRTGDDVGPPSQLHLSTHSLLFEGVRRIDEMSYFQEKLPDANMVLVQRSPAPTEKLPAREMRVLQLVDGQRSLSVIARDSHLGEFEATKVLFQLLQTGWIQAGTRTAPLASAGEAFGDVVDRFNQVYRRVFQAVAAKGKDAQLGRGLASFFQSATEFAPLFVGIELGTDGQLPRDQIVGNLEMAPTDNKLDYLRRGLNELLFFELFTAGEAVDRNEEIELHQQLNQILRDLPGRDATNA